MAKVNYYWELSEFHNGREPLKESIISYHFESQQQGAGVNGTGAGKVNNVPHPGLPGIFVLRERDRWSPQLVTLVTSGIQIPRAIIKVKSFEGRIPTRQIRIELSEVTLVSFQSMEDSAEGAVYEQFGVSYKKFDSEYRAD